MKDFIKSACFLKHSKTSDKLPWALAPVISVAVLCLLVTHTPHLQGVFSQRSFLLSPLCCSVPGRENWGCRRQAWLHPHRQCSLAFCTVQGHRSQLTSRERADALNFHENKSVTKAEHELFPPWQLRRNLQAPPRSTGTRHWCKVGQPLKEALICAPGDVHVSMAPPHLLSEIFLCPISMWFWSSEYIEAIQRWESLKGCCLSSRASL